MWYWKTSIFYVFSEKQGIRRLSYFSIVFCCHRANLESLESLSTGGSGSHGGGGGGTGSSSAGAAGGGAGGQERVVRAFAELARNLQRMRPCVRPAMCKPYGKQSEQLQKSAYPYYCVPLVNPKRARNGFCSEFIYVMYH